MDEGKRGLLCLNKKRFVLMVIILVLSTLGVEHFIKEMSKPRFNSAEELKIFLETNYPKGTRIEELSYKIAKLTGSCGCGVLPQSEFKLHKPSSDNGRMFACGYYTGFLSKVGIGAFGIFIFTDENNKIFEIHVTRHEGFKA